MGENSHYIQWVFEKGVEYLLRILVVEKYVRILGENVILDWLCLGYYVRILVWVM